MYIIFPPCKFQIYSLNFLFDENKFVMWINIAAVGFIQVSCTFVWMSVTSLPSQCKWHQSESDGGTNLGTKWLECDILGTKWLMGMEWPTSTFITYFNKNNITLIVYCGVCISAFSSVDRVFITELITWTGVRCNCVRHAILPAPDTFANAIVSGAMQKPSGGLYMYVRA